MGWEPASARRPAVGRSPYGRLVALGGPLWDTASPVKQVQPDPRVRAVTEGHPWDEYRKAKLPRGWAYPLGQERIAEALKGVGATVGSLSLGKPDLPPKSGPLTVFDVVWLGDAAA